MSQIEIHLNNVDYQSEAHNAMISYNKDIKLLTIKAL